MLIVDAGLLWGPIPGGADVLCAATPHTLRGIKNPACSKPIRVACGLEDVALGPSSDSCSCVHTQRTALLPRASVDA
jgi:hypothetical protein